MVCGGLHRNICVEVRIYTANVTLLAYMQDRFSRRGGIRGNISAYGSGNAEKRKTLTATNIFDDLLKYV